MTFHVDLCAEFAAAVVMLCWLVFAVVLIQGTKGASRSTKTQDLKSHVGFLVQCVAYAVCFWWSRTYFSPLVPMSPTAECITAAFASLVGIASAWFCFAAARALGRQWALVARVIEGHELIGRGPYALVRNPIYLAMLGMLLATGFAFSRWQALAAATVVFLIGTEIRIRSEETLLRATFGTQFEDYARRVPALFPHIFERR